MQNFLVIFHSLLRQFPLQNEHLEGSRNTRNNFRSMPFDEIEPLEALIDASLSLVHQELLN